MVQTSIQPAVSWVYACGNELNRIQLKWCRNPIEEVAGSCELQQQRRYSMERHHLLVDCEFQGLKMNSLCKDIKGHKKVIWLDI